MASFRRPCSRHPSRFLAYRMKAVPFQRVQALGRFEPPITPDREEARRWAEEELSKPKYPEARPSWIDQLWRDFLEWLDSLGGDGTVDGANFAVPVIIALAVVLIVVAVLVVRPRLNARRKSAAAGIYGKEPVVDASAYRKLARDAAGNGDWPAAVVEQFRALVRSAEERDIIESRAGRTADEAAVHLGQVFEAAQTRLDDAAHLFDAVRYGKQAATREDYDTVRLLDSELLNLTPDFEAHSRHGFAVPR
ncbi:DUF4129 domain-containing protein [Paenarthrobacter sp. NPDC089322]|uniref:DUF4129 domain-containing protein n=1 Tax=Paenarthrobacter sp. NPDC089322 TaxID=3155065 RepID=UPI00343A4EC1